MIKTVELNDVSIPVSASLGVEQSYASLIRETILEMADGSALKQVYAGTQDRLTTTIRGEGFIPPGLAGLDFAVPILVKCAEPRSITSTLNVIAIPSARRSDVGYEPFGIAIIGNTHRCVPVVMTVDTATVEVTPGATGYQVLWYPEFSAYAVQGFDESGVGGDASPSWAIELRQI